MPIRNLSLFSLLLTGKELPYEDVKLIHAPSLKKHLNFAETEGITVQQYVQRERCDHAANF